MNNIAILTTTFNHTDNYYFKNNWKSFCEFINNSNLTQDLYICEILPDGSDSISILENANHYSIYNNSQIWHKESAINFLLTKLPDKYRYILLLDNDIIFENSDWYKKIQLSLDSYGMLQPFDTIKYLEANNKDIEKIDNSACYFCENNKCVAKEGNPGMAVLYSRDYLDHMNGLFDESIIGGGDILNIIPFFSHTHTIPIQIFEIICKDSILRYINYIFKAKLYIEQNKIKSSYIKNSTVNHLFHGYLKDRQYSKRYDLINKRNLGEITKETDTGFYELIDENLHIAIKNYFNERQSLKYINKPKIITNSKYGCDNDNVLWLTPCDEIIFRDISKITIKLKKHHHLDNIKITINNNHINISTLLSTNEMILTINNPIKLEIYSENPPVIHNDDRKLGLLITEINVFNEISNRMETYPLCEVM